jgi:hypothetical protein
VRLPTLLRSARMSCGRCWAGRRAGNQSGASRAGPPPPKHCARSRAQPRSWQAPAAPRPSRRCAHHERRLAGARGPQQRLHFARRRRAPHVGEDLFDTPRRGVAAPEAAPLERERCDRDRRRRACGRRRRRRRRGRRERQRAHRIAAAAAGVAAGVGAGVGGAAGGQQDDGHLVSPRRRRARVVGGAVRRRAAAGLVAAGAALGAGRRGRQAALGRAAGQLADAARGRRGLALVAQRRAVQEPAAARRGGDRDGIGCECSWAWGTSRASRPAAERRTLLPSAAAPSMLLTPPPAPPPGGAHHVLSSQKPANTCAKTTTGTHSAVTEVEPSSPVAVGRKGPSNGDAMAGLGRRGARRRARAPSGCARLTAGRAARASPRVRVRVRSPGPRAALPGDRGGRGASSRRRDGGPQPRSRPPRAYLPRRTLPFRGSGALSGRGTAFEVPKDLGKEGLGGAGTPECRVGATPRNKSGDRAPSGLTAMICGPKRKPGQI